MCAWVGGGGEDVVDEVGPAAVGVGLALPVELALATRAHLDPLHTFIYFIFFYFTFMKEYANYQLLLKCNGYCSLVFSIFIIFT